MNLEKILLKLSKYLHENQVPHVIVGGWAAIAWGRQRTTFDIDLIIDQRYLNLSSFVKYLKDIDMIAEEEDIKLAIKEKSHSSILFSLKPSLRIDLKGVYTEEDKEAIKTAQKLEIKNTIVNIGSPENLIAHKLKFGSDRDLEDALIVYIVQKSENNLNIKYLEKTCLRLGVNRKLEELIILADKQSM